MINCVNYVNVLISWIIPILNKILKVKDHLSRFECSSLPAGETLSIPEYCEKMKERIIIVSFALIVIG